MHIGVPKEIKNHEYRVGMIPANVRELAHHGHQISVQTGAGSGAGHDDSAYRAAGARIVSDAETVFAECELIIKVKEPQAEERALLSPEQALFTYLHLAADEAQTHELIGSKATCIAYETVTDSEHNLPLLVPMSVVAGRMSIQAGAMCLEKNHGGSGVLLGGVAGVAQGRVVIIGGGVVGQNAAQMAVGLGARVTILDNSVTKLQMIDRHFGNLVQTLYATQDAVHRSVTEADLVVGAVLVPGAEAPRLVTRQWISEMKAGSVIVDVAIDQGGCIETSRPTTHASPTYVEENVVHYCVTNMPGAVPQTSAAALNNATLPYVLQLANKGIRQALLDNDHLMNGLNVCDGHLTNEFVAEAHGLNFVEPLELLSH